MYEIPAKIIAKPAMSGDQLGLAKSNVYSSLGGKDSSEAAEELVNI